MSHSTPGVNRDEAARRVLMAVAVGHSPVVLEYVAPDGSQPLVVTTPNEYLSEVIARVNALGGSANVAIAQTKSFRLMTIEGFPEDTSSPVDDEYNKDISMGMFVIRAGDRGGQGSSFRIRSTSVNVSMNSRSFAYA